MYSLPPIASVILLFCCKNRYFSTNKRKTKEDDGSVWYFGKKLYLWFFN